MLSIFCSIAERVTNQQFSVNIRRRSSESDMVVGKVRSAYCCCTYLVFDYDMHVTHTMCEASDKLSMILKSIYSIAKTASVRRRMYR